MVGRLRRILVCSPRAAGWGKPERLERWRELGFRHAPDVALAQVQHDHLCRELVAAGTEIMELPSSDVLSLDAVYAHDASLATDFGLLVMRPGKVNRVVEGESHRAFAEGHGMGVFGQVREPGTT